jgi:uncharacterized protein (DUF1330 family)
MTNENKRFEVLVGLHVSDEDGYAKYREGMTPLLHSVGGCFRLDLQVSAMLRGDAEDPFNRVFIISFPDESTMDAFFRNEQYQRIRAEFFDPSVKSYSRIASFEHEIAQPQ